MTHVAQVRVYTPKRIWPTPAAPIEVYVGEGRYAALEEERHKAMFFLSGDEIAREYNRIYARAVILAGNGYPERAKPLTAIAEEVERFYNQGGRLHR